MTTPKLKKNSRVQLRVFTVDRVDGTFTERQIFETRAAALDLLGMSQMTSGMLMDRPQEGGVAEGDNTYAVLIPWHRISEVDILAYPETECG